ncbi:MAG: hypothetical protein H8D72_01050 [Planctomycetes bacterium]|nr:hypothetical protein [Planctomycetota bacterium]
MLTSLLALSFAPMVQTPFVDQPADHANDGLYFSDVSTYDPLWGTTQYLADNFTVPIDVQIQPTSLVWFGADYQATFTGTDDFRVNFYEAKITGEPGPLIYQYSGPQPTVTATGYLPSGQAFPWTEKRYEISLSAMSKLTAGDYVVEVYNDTTTSSDGTWGWAVGIADTTHGVDGAIFTDDAGLNWYSLNQTFAFELNADEIPSMTVDVPSVSISSAGSQNYGMDAGLGHAFEPYLMLGSFAGTTPGFDFGGRHIPLNLDVYFNYLLTYPNGPITPGSFGVLDAAGKSTAAFNMFLGFSPSLAGLVGNHLFVALDPVTFELTFVSNTVSLDILP